MWQLWDDMAYFDAAMWLDLVMWTNGWVPRGMLWDPLSVEFCHGGAHLCWHGLIGLWHVTDACWLGPLWCCHVAHPISSSIMYSLCFLHPVCTQGCCCPQVVLRITLIKSQPLINSFNMFYLLWIYFNSSPYPKIMKFWPKIPKFMMISPVIFNSTFSPVSLHWKFIFQDNPIFLSK
jgi:hypothetical protein